MKYLLKIPENDREKPFSKILIKKQISFLLIIADHTFCSIALTGMQQLKGSHLTLGNIAGVVPVPSI